MLYEKLVNKPKVPENILYHLCLIDHQAERIIKYDVFPRMEEHWSDFSYDMEHISCRYSKEELLSTFAIDCFIKDEFDTRRFVTIDTSQGVLLGEMKLRNHIDKEFEYWSVDDEEVLKFAKYAIGPCSPTIAAEFIALLILTILFGSMACYETRRTNDWFAFAFLFTATAIWTIWRLVFYIRIRNTAKLMKDFITQKPNCHEVYDAWRNWIDEKNK